MVSALYIRVAQNSRIAGSPASIMAITAIMAMQDFGY
jgi:hypothetical protein